MRHIAHGKKFYLKHHKDLFSILCDLIFFFCYLFWIMCETDFASYVDDDRPNVSGDSIDDALNHLRMIP